MNSGCFVNIVLYNWSRAVIGITLVPVLFLLITSCRIFLLVSEDLINYFLHHYQLSWLLLNMSANSHNYVNLFHNCLCPGTNFIIITLEYYKLYIISVRQIFLISWCFDNLVSSYFKYYLQAGEWVGEDTFSVTATSLTKILFHVRTLKFCFSYFS